MATITIDVDLDEFDDDDLIEEIESRGFTIIDSDESIISKEDVKKLFYEYQNNSEKFNESMRSLFYDVLGKIA